MSDPTRFDPYTGDPIPDTTPQEQSVYNQPETPATEQPVYNQPEASATEQSVYNQPEAPAPEQPIYSQPQYNPYTGQPLPDQNQVSPDQMAAQDRKATNFATASLVLGICSIVLSFCSCFCCPFLALLTGILAIIFNRMSNPSNGQKTGVAKAGLITGIIGLVLCVLFSNMIATTFNS